MTCPFCRAENDDDAEVCRKCGKSFYALTDGSILAGRYEIVQPLGKGGMGLVYKARDRDLREIVAIKVLRSQGESPELARRFRSEIRFARKVRHPNVCAIHDFGQDDYLRFIVMEYVEGVDLKHLLRRHGPFPPAHAFEMAIQAARGLEAVHSAGIVHRDLKTANIMRDNRGVVRLMDFGIAKQFDAESATGATVTGQVLGTPEYMSPEQARGQKVDIRTDIYALGVVLYELLTGDVPFRGDTPVATLLMHIQDAPALTGPKAERIPACAIPVLERALAKARDDRYDSARAILLALQEALPLHTATAGTITKFPATSPVPLVEEDPQTLTQAATPVPTFVPARLPSSGETSTTRTNASGRGVSPRPKLFAGRRTPARVLAAAAVGAAMLGAWASWRRTSPDATRAPARLEEGVAATESQPTAPPVAATETGPPLLTSPGRGQELELEEAGRPVALAWKGIPGTASYRVVVGASPDLRRPLIERQGVTTRSLEVRGLVEGRYYWRVEAISPDGTRSPSAESSFVLRLAAKQRDSPATVGGPRSAAETSPRPEPAVQAALAQEPPAPSPTPPPAQEPAPARSVSAAALPGSTLATEVDERGAIERVLERYRLGIESQDVAALKQVWPDMPSSIERTIRESFRSSTSHRVELRLKDLATSGGIATATCDRSDEILSREGQRLRHTSTARFILRKKGGSWLIEAIN